MKLPHGEKIMLSDTVGFISDLPTMLVSAFRATLEEVIEADVVLHVRDISHEDTEAQSEDVERILEDLGIEAHDPRIVEVWNKVDLLPPDRAQALRNQAARSERRASSCRRSPGRASMRCSKASRRGCRPTMRTWR